MKNCLFTIVGVLLLNFSGWSQAIHEDERYVPETDPLVLEKLKQWQGLKFGLLMHWGAYSQWGIVESWSLCPEEYGWCVRTKGSDPDNYFTYKQEYENLALTFNPVNFNPEKWAKAAKAAGMKYVVFTTKHHDGFSMFDSKYTDYKINGSKSIFRNHPKANVTREIFNAFRAEGLWAGAYFSKPDWHSEYYWDPKYPPRDRNVNYEPEANPERWQQFTDFTHNQILELLTDYGKVDILWLDGGWVAKTPKGRITDWYRGQLGEQNTNGYLKHRIVNQDIKMDELVVKAREKQPGLIVVDRAVYGKNQNYLTPENRVPEKALPYPWESCIISGGGWSHTFGARYMSGYQGVQMLVDIVAKGGNLLLNIAPGPDGTWQQGAYDLLQEYADWMEVNAEAIYETHAIAPYKEGKVAMTQKEDGTTYFFYMADEKETTMPREIRVKSLQPADGAKVSLLGGGNLRWKKDGDGFVVTIPEKWRKNPPSNYVWTLKVTGLR